MTAIRLDRYLQRDILIPDQNVPGKRRVVILAARRVESPILTNAVTGVAVALLPVITLSGAARTHLQYEVRRLADLAYHVSVATDYPLGVAHALGEDAVRVELQGASRVHDEIHLPSHQDVVPVPVAGHERSGEIDQFSELNHVRLPGRVG